MAWIFLAKTSWTIVIIPDLAVDTYRRTHNRIAWFIVMRTLSFASVQTIEVVAIT